MDSPASTKRFRIAFSFAGEKRDFVKQVADLLAKRFGQGKILYDKYHEAEFANADLAFALPSLYKADSDLIIAVFCTDYEKKRMVRPGMAGHLLHHQGRRQQADHALPL